MTVLSFAKKQLLQSMLTGVPQIIAVRGIFRKLMKSIVLVGCLGGCAYQVWSFMSVYWTYPIVVDVIVSKPNTIDIPAFTICEYNGLKATKFCSNYPALCTPNKRYSEFCTTYFALCGKGSIDEPPEELKLPAVPPQELPTDKRYIRNFYKYIGIGELEFIQEVAYNGRDVKGILLPVFNGEGVPTNCYAYNVVWNDPNATQQSATIRNQLFISPWTKHNSILPSLQYREVRDHVRKQSLSRAICRGVGCLGGGLSKGTWRHRMKEKYEILVTMNGNDYFYNSTPLAIQMVVHSPFTKLNPFTDGFSVKTCTTYKMYLEKTENYLLPAPYITNCTDYEQMWRSRGGNGPLTKKMCVDECVFNKSISKYDCFDPIQVTHPNDAKFCFNNVVDENSLDECDKDCQPACFEESFKVNIEEFETSLTSNQNSKQKCLTGITISFIRTQVEKFVYSKKYELIEAFGYVGGFLGMWLGLSLIAVCDFVETCLVILIYAAKRLKKRNEKTRIRNLQRKKLFLM